VVILDKPYISDLMLQYLSDNNIMVLDNEFARECSAEYKLNLVDDEKFKQEFLKTGKIYTTSENALEWLYVNLPEHDIVKKIQLLKDKTAFRKKLEPLYPEFFYRELSTQELINYKDLRYPFVIKPAVGFLSLGVYTVYNEADFNTAIAEIQASETKWAENFPAAVIKKSRYILEEYIPGKEYAIDFYYDKEGQPVILNIFTHKFASAVDVSDRVYYTSKEIIEQYKLAFEEFFQKANKYLELKDFPVHAEVRMHNGKVYPIEFNPMRFAGLSSTDVAYYAYGIMTVDYFLHNKRPDFANILANKGNLLYSLILLDKTDKNVPCKAFDYEKLDRSFKKVLALRKIDNPALDVFGFVFAETALTDEQELDYILKSDLREFYKAAVPVNNIL